MGNSWQGQRGSEVAPLTIKSLQGAARMRTSTQTLSSLLSLFRALFARFFGLFGCAGNSASKSLKLHANSRLFGGQHDAFPVLFPVSREIAHGDGFASDCVHHHTK